MEEYYFLFLIAGIWTIAAIMQDLKKREVANWLNFSFIAVGLSYRAFYSSVFANKEFFIYGVLGFLFMFIMAYALYYGRAFAGGDAKLLMGFGIILPYKSYLDILVLGIGAILVLFLSGLIWSLLYSVYLVERNKEKFKKEFEKNWNKYRAWFFISIFVLLFLSMLIGIRNGWVFGGFIVLFSLIWIYVKSLDGILLKEKNVKELREGDWIEEGITVKGKKIEKSVHGLSLEEIEYLRKNAKRRKILIKEGIPFTPAFLGALIVMVFFLEALLSYLSLVKTF